MAVLIRRLEEQDKVAAFDCGDEALNDYLNRHAWANRQKISIGVTYVALDEGAPLSVIGYFTLATASVPPDAFPKKYVRGLPPYDLPLILLARLAVDRRFSGKGLGHALISEAFKIALRVADAGMPLHHYRRISGLGRLVCALWFHRPGGYRRERSPKNVSRHKNSPYGTEGLAVGLSLLEANAASLLILQLFRAQCGARALPEVPRARAVYRFTGD